MSALVLAGERGKGEFFIWTGNFTTSQLFVTLTDGCVAAYAFSPGERSWIEIGYKTM